MKEHIKLRHFPGCMSKRIQIDLINNIWKDNPNSRSEKSNRVRSNVYKKIRRMGERARIKERIEQEVQMELFNPEVAEALEKEIGRILNEEYWGSCTLTQLACHMAEWCHKNNISTKNIMKDTISIIENEDTKNIDYAYHNWKGKLRMVIMWCNDEINFHDELTY